MTLVWRGQRKSNGRFYLKGVGWELCWARKVGMGLVYLGSGLGFGLFNNKGPFV